MPGLAPDIITHIFEKFFRSSDARPGGAGLGLSIARGFIEAVDGTLDAFNQPGKGAAFVIRLPLEKVPESDELVS